MPPQGLVRLLPPPRNDSIDEVTPRPAPKAHSGPAELARRSTDISLVVDEPVLRRSSNLSGRAVCSPASESSSDRLFNVSADTAASVVTVASMGLAAYTATVIGRSIENYWGINNFDGKLAAFIVFSGAGFMAALPLAAVPGMATIIGIDTAVSRQRMPAHCAVLPLITVSALYVAAASVGIFFAEKAFKQELHQKQSKNKTAQMAEGELGNRQPEQISPQATPPMHLARLMAPAPATWQVTEPQPTAAPSSPEPASKS